MDALRKHFIEYASQSENLIKASLTIWNNGKTFEDACDINILYLKGLIPSSPYSVRLFRETDISKDLIHASRAGVLVTETYLSTLGFYEEGDVPNASLMCWLLNKDASRMVKHLSKYGNRFEIEIETAKFSEVFGDSYKEMNNKTVGYYITDTKKNTNDLFRILSSFK